jgi:hypothetical protein
MAAYAILFELSVHQLAVRIPLEGATQRGALRTFPTLMKFAAAKLRICANPVNRFYFEKS